MNSLVLKQSIKTLLADRKGLLAMDESIDTCNKRFAKLGIAQTKEARRAYRELIITTPNLNHFISGLILCDETIRQSKANGTPFLELISESGMMIGIKVDTGAKNMAGHPKEKITEGLDRLRIRLAEYSKMGAKFCKWRAVFRIDEPSIPTQASIEANAFGLARYAALCHEADLVPIIEPEVLMSGTHSIQKCGEISEIVLRSVFGHLISQDVLLENIILKTNMILSGSGSFEKVGVNEVANLTVQSLLRSVPAAVPGIAFLSGGQSALLASKRLNAMNMKSRLPWTLTFSFARAIQKPGLEIWQGKAANLVAAQNAIYHRAHCNSAARSGEYSSLVENSLELSVAVLKDPYDQIGMEIHD